MARKKTPLVSGKEKQDRIDQLRLINSAANGS
jgi:hypothetical protein